jgi:hypothetical protein
MKYHSEKHAKPTERKVRVRSLVHRSSGDRHTKKGSPVVGYMSLEEQVNEDFSFARRKALLGRIGARLRRGNAWHRLFCFDDVGKVPGAVGRIHRGKRTVPVVQIGGSVGRCSEFDRDFLPAKASVEERWKRIDLAFHRGEELPPVSLYKLGGFYFVLDGHHRVSVAHYHGVEWMDAEVTEFSIPQLEPPHTVEEL